MISKRFFSERQAETIRNLPDFMPVHLVIYPSLQTWCLQELAGFPVMSLPKEGLSVNKIMFVGTDRLSKGQSGYQEHGGFKAAVENSALH